MCEYSYVHFKGARYGHVRERYFSRQCFESSVRLYLYYIVLNRSSDKLISSELKFDFETRNSSDLKSVK